MNATTEAPQITLGEPQVAAPLAVFPVIAEAGPTLAYRTFSQATSLGAFVKELDTGASVNDLLLHNPTDLPLLVYEGEEVLGAQQNRTFDTSTLVAADAIVQLPVSCVERGRWDGARSAEHFSPSPQTADPGLRRAKRVMANAAAAAGAPARPSQAAVWREVDLVQASMEIESPTASMHDTYEARRGDLSQLTSAVEHVPGQIGALAAIAGKPVALDLVSREDVFAALLPRLAQGYALDALGQPDAQPDPLRVTSFLHDALAAPRTPLPTPGMGRGVAIHGARAVGSGLEHEGELIALSAFPADDERAETAGPAPRAGRIARPSRRRRPDPGSQR